MVRKTVFSREDVIAAGLAVVEQEGLVQMSARRVAEEMGASTAPVYSNFASMDDLESAVKQAAVDLMLDAITRQYTNDRFQNMGIGVLEFAWSRPRLYKALFLECQAKHKMVTDVMDRLLGILAQEPALADLAPSERFILLKKMAIFTHGLATDICTGNSTRFSKEQVLFLLNEVGEVVTRDALTRPPRTEEEIAILSSFDHCGSGETARLSTLPEEDEKP